ncbi:putative dipeptidyl-aminopeptidase B [Erysiphe neolycopersici]|uniref:dipeptidyl-peptidase IV n=1 Tax=Erysiphe neolycopersici TaxID=212602 RepID=A0A420HZV7_9PEZI|nr:putative dipeptidyl-aminopeptidase B [Erysiphe neolycopersici]
MREDNAKDNSYRLDRDRISEDSRSSGSTSSLIFAHINEHAAALLSQSENGNGRSQKSTMISPFSPKSGTKLSRYSDDGYIRDRDDFDDDDYKHESSSFLTTSTKIDDKRFRRLLWGIGIFFAGAWVVALIVFLGQHTYTNNPLTTQISVPYTNHGNGKKIMLDQIVNGDWEVKKQKISWIEGPLGEDGLLLKQDSPGDNYLVVEDIRKSMKSAVNIMDTMVLMKESDFSVGERHLSPSRVFPSKDLKKVLVATDSRQNWRHSFLAKYWIFDVESQTAEPLDPAEPNKSIQLASWSPQSNAIVFTRDNNLFLRSISSSEVVQITTDGSADLFYGVPDWVYEEEVFSGNSATWWAENGKYIAFLRTNESTVPEFPIQYFVSRPSKAKPLPGEENYPEVREIKYPKAGAPNPTVDLQFYDVEKGEVFQVKTPESFPSDDLLITEVVWAGSTKALIRESNRESDILRVVLIDVQSRAGKTVRTENLQGTGEGWFEVTENTKYVPKDPLSGRPDDGYIDTIFHNDYNHLGYFTPLDNPNPIVLTSGEWEVENAPSAIDLKNNLVYFVATKESPIQRHVYSVKLDGSELKSLTDSSTEGYYDVLFSSGTSFALLNYDGPNIPWQRVISTHGNLTRYDDLIEDNSALANLTKEYDLPINVYSTINIDGFELQVVERRPPFFSEEKKYPVLFHLYGGPGSQTVNKKFSVDFDSYVAANLGYIVVTVDGRGTGFIGRKARTVVRGNLGYYEAYDQIEAAKIWASKDYIDPSKIAIWGWSYGGFMTLKTLEQDAGKTFSYGMAVAPVTDWRLYDSIYTERYMRTPKHNPTGYKNSSISNVTALHQSVRFLIMHGTADDNVHLQNTLTLLDKLDLAGVENYDVQMFPDSDHAIHFHNADHIVYHKLSNWLINAFNGEWHRVSNPVPKLY